MTELETMQRAKLYMDKLARGIDPISEREIDADSVLNQVRLVRCFFYVSEVLQRVIDNGGIVGSGRKRTREFAITPQQLAAVQPVRNALRITEFTKLLHLAAGDPEMKQLNAGRITDWLLLKGFLENSMAPDGKTCRLPTEAGRSIGIRSQHRRGPRGEYVAVLYEPQAQQFLLDHYWEIVSK